MVEEMKENGGRSIWHRARISEADKTDNSLARIARMSVTGVLLELDYTSTKKKLLIPHSILLSLWHGKGRNTYVP